MSWPLADSPTAPPPLVKGKTMPAAHSDAAVAHDVLGGTPEGAMDAFGFSCSALSAVPVSGALHIVSVAPGCGGGAVRAVEDCRVLRAGRRATDRRA